MKSTVHAFALHTLRYGDSSLIVSCFTKQYGLQSYMLRGILGGKRKKKVSKSLFEPLNLVTFEASKTNANKLGYLNEAHILQPYTAIPFDLKKKAVIFFLAEVIYQIVQEEQEANPDLFSFLEKRMRWLDQVDNIGLFHIKFLLDLTRYMGFYPNLSEKKAPYFDLQEGCMSHHKPKHPFIEGPTKDLWVLLLGTDFDKLQSIRLSHKGKMTLLECILNYFKLHLQQFKIPKSSAVLNEVFKTP